MGQKLRVVAWLRFASKSTLTRGLDAFAENEAPGYFATADWKVDGLDAHLAIDRELPGDFERVQAPFMAMVRAAAHGYVDYFESGRDRPWDGDCVVDRWACGIVDKKLMVGRTVPFEAADGVLLLSGKLGFVDESLASAAVAQLPMRLPALGSTGATELMLGSNVFRTSGTALLADATILAPIVVFADPIAEAISAVAATAKNGSLTISQATRKLTVKAGGKRSSSLYARPMKIEIDPSHAPIVPIERECAAL